MPLQRQMSYIGHQVRTVFYSSTNTWTLVDLDVGQTGSLESNNQRANQICSRAIRMQTVLDVV